MSTYQLHAALKLTTSLNRSVITQHGINSSNSKDFNNYTFLTYVHIIYIIFTEIVIIFNCHVVTAIQPTTFVSLYTCDNSTTLRMEAISAETCWSEYCE